MPRQALVIHEQQLHGLVERDLVLAQEFDAAGGADPLQQRLDTVRIDGLRLGTFEPRQDGAVGAVTGARQGERAIQPHGNLIGLRQQAVPLQSESELTRGPHRPHGVRARGPDTDLENVENAESHGTSRPAANCSGRRLAAVGAPSKR